MSVIRNLIGALLLASVCPWIPQAVCEAPPEPPLLLFGVIKASETGVRETTGTIQIDLIPSVGGETITARGNLSDIGGKFSYRLLVPTARLQNPGHLIDGHDYTYIVHYNIGAGLVEARPSPETSPPINAGIGNLQELSIEGTVNVQDWMLY